MLPPQAAFADFKISVGGVEINVTGLAADGAATRTVAQAQDQLAANVPLLSMPPVFPATATAPAAGNGAVTLANASGNQYALLLQAWQPPQPT
jgi:flagellin